MRAAIASPSVRQRPDHVERPQRPTAVEMLGHQPADDAPQVGLRVALRVAVAPDVLADVEGLGRHPPWFRAAGVHPVGRVGRSRAARPRPRAAPRCPAPSPGSRIRSLRVCPAIDADSSLRMRPSSSERRSGSSLAARATAYGSPTAATPTGARCNDEAHARLRLPGVPGLHRSSGTAVSSCGGAALGLHRRVGRWWRCTVVRPRSTAKPGCAARRPTRWAATGWCRRARIRRRAAGAWLTH